MNDFSKTGLHPDAVPVVARSLSIEERIELWFIQPLRRMKDDDGFVALLICLPLIEKIVRYKADALEREDLTFSEGSVLVKKLAKFLEIAEADAQLFWQQFRVGMLHRAMIKPTVGYQLDAKWVGPAVTVQPDRTFCINVWKLRDKVVRELKSIGTKIWKDPTCPLPVIYIELAEKSRTRR